MVSVDSLVSHFLEVWPAFLVGVSAVYILHLYRRARLTEPPREARGGFFGELVTWLWLDWKRTFGALAGVFTLAIGLSKVLGWTLAASLQLDPIALANLGALTLVGTRLEGFKVPLYVWVAVIGGLLVIGIVYGTVWKNDYFEDA